jgi:ABC-type sugar transport system substrate-binding protein
MRRRDFIAAAASAVAVPAAAQQARSVRIGWIPGYSRQMVKPFLEAARAALAEQGEARYI